LLAEDQPSLASVRVRNPKVVAVVVHAVEVGDPRSVGRQRGLIHVSEGTASILKGDAPGGAEDRPRSASVQPLRVDRWKPPYPVGVDDLRAIRRERATGLIPTIGQTLLGRVGPENPEAVESAGQCPPDEQLRPVPRPRDGVAARAPPPDPSVRGGRAPPPNPLYPAVGDPTTDLREGAPNRRGTRGTRNRSRPVNL